MTELNFKGKEFVYNHHLAVPFRPLEMHADKGIGDPSLDGNLIIDGDNLHALKALLPLYAGKVDCIFIDPPYNTGNEGWCYNDNVNAPMIKEWLDSNPIGIEDGLRHDKWCAMMWPRLRLLHDLLAEDGLFLMHIDENELERATALIDEIFGNDPEDPSRTNRLGSIIWDKKNPKGDARGVSYQHEFVILAAKNRTKTVQSRPLKRPKINADKMIEAAKSFFSKVGKEALPADIEAVIKKYDLEIDASGIARHYDIEMAAAEYAEWVSSNDALTGGERPYNKIDQNGDAYRLVHMGWPNKKPAPEEYFRDIKHPISGVPCPVPVRGWRYPPKTIDRMMDGDIVYEPMGYIRKGEIVFGPDETVQPQRKYLLKDHSSENIPSIIRFGGSDDDFLKSIGLSFENAKPFKFVGDLVRWFTHPSDLILDSFAGSGTLGHAVLRANRLDGGSRKFVLIQMDEGEGGADADTVTAERMRRVVRGVDGVENDDIRLEAAFTYCTLGEPVELDKVLSGEDLPPYASLGAALFHMATNEALEPATVDEAAFYLGESQSEHVWLIYKPDLDWLKSPEAALTLSRAKDFAAAKPGKKHLVFAPARFVSQKMLNEQNIPVEFVPLPFSLYRIERS